MDADALRMLADLGLERRDVVSAPDEIPRARQQREDPREQAAVAAAFEKRREESSRDGVGGVDDRSARLRAWNNQTTFESDEVTGQLENRWSGQGHRAALNRQQLRHEDPWEAVDARYGEERRLFLQQRGDNSNNPVPSGPRTSGSDRFLQEVLGGKVPSLNIFGGTGRCNKRINQAPRAAATRARAPSPRGFGTVRFAPDGRRIEPNGSVRQPVVNPGLEAAKILRARARAQVSEDRPVTQTASGIENQPMHGKTSQGNITVNGDAVKKPGPDSLSLTAQKTTIAPPDGANAIPHDLNQINGTSAEGQHSSPEASIDTRSSSSGTDDTTETVASSPPRFGLGTLIGQFFDFAGTFLSSHHLPINVPVKATLRIDSRSPHFNPRDLADAMESLAQSMVDRRQGLEGVRQTENGLWVEE